MACTRPAIRASLRVAALIVAATLLPGCMTSRAASSQDEPAVSGPIAFCGIDNFAWTVDGALARSAQPPAAAWSCLKQRGLTTIVRQNIEGGDSAERQAVQQAGMIYLGQYQIVDQTAYSPAQLSDLLNDIVTRITRGERILVHDAGGRGRMGFWEAAFLLWDGWSSRDAIDRYIQFGWKIECAKGGNGQMQGINEIAAALGQPAYYPAEDAYGTPWNNCPRPQYMSGWDYREVRWPAGGGQLWSKRGLTPAPTVRPRAYLALAWRA
jgi:hypothetical protein